MKGKKEYSKQRAHAPRCKGRNEGRKTAAESRQQGDEWENVRLGAKSGPNHSNLRAHCKDVGFYPLASNKSL